MKARIVEIKALSNGAHRNQTINEDVIIPKGWAIVPNNMECKNFPFGEIVVEEKEGILVVSNWVPCEIPKQSKIIVNQLDVIEAQITYTAMMTDTLICAKTMKEKFLQWYKQGLWNEQKVKDAVAKNILIEEEANDIINSTAK